MNVRFLRGLGLIAAALATAGCSTFLGGNLVTEGKPNGAIIVQNNSGYSINTITISRCSAMSHGLDQLRGSIEPGQSMRWQVDADCWDTHVAYVGNGMSALAKFNGIRVNAGQTWRLTVGPQGEENRESTY
ncbi:hypothetical protein [Paraurantiacibacter namhicola]|uniref:Lipoprotein n=1 Tax=Paraurantiacibacter namhicola TaxID=645517 RepID=A0A1C7D6M2_9SPHN|nr:hypothetical protein [Paraurantiacibacter namhicola]ANU06953.1 hypothetical protein A6F65_00631 [Paraurantiacibacter namhicola]